MPDVATPVPARLELPARLDLPLFVYGLLQPGAPAYEGVMGPVVGASAAATLASGSLRLRDGLPLLDLDGTGGVSGFLLSAPAGGDRALYEAVCGFEPRQHYRWLIAEAAAAEGTRTANVLQGRHPERGSAEEWFPSWSAHADPVMHFGFHQVRRMALEHASAPVAFLAPDSPTLWERFFSLQACYLLLWSVLDRYTALALGPAEEPLARAYALGADPAFRDHVREADVPARAKVADSRDPGRWRRIRDDGSGAMYAWEAVRTTLGHPGRTASDDAALLRRSIVELHDSLRLDVLRRLPGLAGAWAELDPDGRSHRWLLRPEVDPDGLG